MRRLCLTIASFVLVSSGTPWIPYAGGSATAAAPRVDRVEVGPEATGDRASMLADLRREAARTLHRPAAEIRLVVVDPPPTGGPRRVGSSQRTPRHYGVVAVPAGLRVERDGTVSPVGPQRTRVDPTFTPSWGDEQYFNWIYYDIDDGGWLCRTTRGEIRGQFEFARLPNVSSDSRYDYWGVSARAVAEVTHRSGNCTDTISRFTLEVQSRSAGSLAVGQDPRSGSDGNCTSRELRVMGTFGGVTAGIAQTVPWCERWTVRGALAGSAGSWYGIGYDHQGHWHAYQREGALLEIIRVRKGADPALNTRLGLEVDNR